MWDPREKSQRVRGRAREAGWEDIMGTSKRERVDMPPAPRRAVDMLKTWRAWDDAMMRCLIDGFGVFRVIDVGSAEVGMLSWLYIVRGWLVMKMRDRNAKCATPSDVTVLARWFSVNNWTRPPSSRM